MQSTTPWIFLTLWISSCSAFLPMSDILRWWQPDWVLLMLCLWMLISEGRLPTWIIFVCACYQDMLLNVLFGTHALAYLTALQVLHTFYPRVRHYTVLQSTLMMTLVVGISELIKLYIFASQSGYPHHLMVWGTTVSTLASWPILLYFSKEASVRRSLPFT